MKDELTYYLSAQIEYYSKKGKYEIVKILEKTLSAIRRGV